MTSNTRIFFVNGTKLTKSRSYLMPCIDFLLTQYVLTILLVSSDWECWVKIYHGNFEIIDFRQFCTFYKKSLCLISSFWHIEISSNLHSTLTIRDCESLVKIYHRNFKMLDFWSIYRHSKINPCFWCDILILAYRNVLKLTRYAPSIVKVL